MKTSLLKGLNKADVDEMKGLFIGSLRLRKHMIKLLEEKISSNATDRVSKDNFGDPAWPYAQADSNGYERGIREMISILSDEK